MVDPGGSDGLMPKPETQLSARAEIGILKEVVDNLHSRLDDYRKFYIDVLFALGNPDIDLRSEVPEEIKKLKDRVDTLEKAVSFLREKGRYSMHSPDMGGNHGMRFNLIFSVRDCPELDEVLRIDDSESEA
jgi:hypothetical protein